MTCGRAVLPFRLIEVTLDSINHSHGIIDSGCQVVIIRMTYGKIGQPMKHEQVMFLESANGQANTTMGTIPSICFWSVKSVSIAWSRWSRMPLECLLSLPFTSLASTKCRSSRMECTSLLTDPNTWASITVPTQLKSLEACRLPCSQKRFLIVDESGISQGDVHHYISSPLLPRIGSFFSNLFSSSHLTPLSCPAQLHLVHPSSPRLVLIQ